MAELWADVCRQCVSAAADIPASVLLVAFLATALGLFILVRCWFPLSGPAAATPLGARPHSELTYSPAPCYLVSGLTGLGRAEIAGRATRGKAV